MIRILHTADWHLGQTFFGYDRVEEHAHFLDWLARELKENEIDVLLIAGDVFDVSNPSAASQRMFYRFIRRVTTENPQLQLVIVAGNHDSAARLEAPLPLLQEMRTDIKGIVRRRDGEIDYDDLIVELKNRSGEVEALCLAVPFLRQGDYPVVVTDGNPYAEGVKELYTRLQNRAMERRKKDQAIVAVGHLQATGSEIAERDFSERTIIGGLECVSPDTFTEQIAYTALGHIHKPQTLVENQILYAGALEPIDKNDTGKHGYIRGEVTEKGVKAEFVPSAKREYMHLPVEVGKNMTNGFAREKIREMIQINGIENIYKFILTGFRDADITFEPETLKGYGNVIEIVDDYWRRTKEISWEDILRV